MIRSKTLEEAKLDAIRGLLEDEVKGVVISYDEEKKTFYTEWIIMKEEEYDAWWDL